MTDGLQAIRREMRARNKDGTRSTGITEKGTAHKTLRTRRQKYNYIQKTTPGGESAY